MHVWKMEYKTKLSVFKFCFISDVNKNYSIYIWIISVETEE